MVGDVPVTDVRVLVKVVPVIKPDIVPVPPVRVILPELTTFIALICN